MAVLGVGLIATVGAAWARVDRADAWAHDQEVQRLAMAAFTAHPPSPSAPSAPQARCPVPVPAPVAAAALQPVAIDSMTLRRLAQRVAVARPGQVRGLLAGGVLRMAPWTLTATSTAPVALIAGPDRLVERALFIARRIAGAAATADVEDDLADLADVLAMMAGRWVATCGWATAMSRSGGPGHGQ